MCDIHLFADGFVRKLDQSIDEGLAWKRLMEGRQTDIDILLLNHGLEEIRIMESDKSLCYEIAQKMANRKYNWEAAIEQIIDYDEFE